VTVLVNLVSTGDIYEDFHLQTGDIGYLSTGDVAGCKILYFVVRALLVGCARIATGLGLG